jgi:hypothetical protein
MRRNTRLSRSGWAFAALAALAVMLPAGARAGHDEAKLRHRHQVAAPVVYHGDYCRKRAVHPGIHRHQRHGRHQQRARYDCRPCSRQFQSGWSFRRHVQHHHRVAPWRLPFVIVHHSLGWIFYG